MKHQLAPFNIDLLVVTAAEAKNMNEVTSLSIFDSPSKNFQPQGLFSTSIFGKVGSEYRARVFGYINLKIPVLHPMVYHAVCKVKAFYQEVMKGKAYARWNKETKSLEESNAVDGQTGMAFFLENFPNIHFEENESIGRKFNINLIYKAIKENKYLLEYLLVLPAGLRDYTIDQNGRPTEDDVNKFYRKIIIQTSLIDKTTYKLNPASSDYVHFTIQQVCSDLFDYLQDLLAGKNKLILGKWTSRKTFNSTRNVISSNVESANHVDEPTRLDYNESAIGLYQFLRSASPKTTYEIKTNYLTKLFPSLENIAYLTNAKTLLKEQVIIKDIQKDFDNWISPEGIDGLIAKFGNVNLRHNIATLDHGKYYMGLMYNDGKYFKFFQDINELPEGFKKESVKPITLAELLYISVYKLNKKLPGYITRYPIASYGSIYPSMIQMRTTIPSLPLEELDDEWKPSGNIAICFPITDKPFFDTMSPNHSHLVRLGADFDGDTCSLQMVLTDESIEEVNTLFNSARYYVTDQQKIAFSIKSDTLESVLGYMSS